MITENVYIVMHRYRDEYQEQVTEIDRVCYFKQDAERYVKDNYNLPDEEEFCEIGYCRFSDDDEIWIEMEIVY